MEVKMGFPSNETIEAFKQIIEKDGFEEILANLIHISSVNRKITPIVLYLKGMIFDMIDNNLEDEMPAYTNGFVTCLDLFRRQLESELIDIEDLNLQLENIIGWNNYLEEENAKLNDKIKELEKT